MEVCVELRGVIWVGICGMCFLMGCGDFMIILVESFVSLRN